MNKQRNKALTVSRSIAPEDIREGLFVMTMHELRQAAMVNCEGIKPEVIVLQYAARPYETELPRKVLSVCLPFVVLELPDEKVEVVDTRAVRLARVDSRFARLALKPSKLKESKRKSKSKKKRKRHKKSK